VPTTPAFSALTLRDCFFFFLKDWLLISLLTYGQVCSNVKYILFYYAYWNGPLREIGAPEGNLSGPSRDAAGTAHILLPARLSLCFFCLPGPAQGAPHPTQPAFFLSNPSRKRFSQIDP